MSFNNTKTTLECATEEFAVGQPVVAAEGSIYQGLYGVITEIRKEKDGLPEIYCSFEPPVIPYEIEQLEKKASRFFNEEKTLEIIPFDTVLISPQFLEILPFSPKEPHKITVYILEEDWCVEGQAGHQIMIYGDYHVAKKKMNQELAEELKTGCVFHWADDEQFCYESYEDYYEAWLDGEYVQNYFIITLYEDHMEIPDIQFTRLGQAYIM